MEKIEHEPIETQCTEQQHTAKVREAGEACLARHVIVAEGIEGEDDLSDNWVRVRVGTAGVGAGRGGGLLPGAGDDGGALHEPQGAVGQRRLQVLRLLRHCRGVGDSVDGGVPMIDRFLSRIGLIGWVGAVHVMGPGSGARLAGRCLVVTCQRGGGGEEREEAVSAKQWALGWSSHVFLDNNGLTPSF